MQPKDPKWGIRKYKCKHCEQDFKIAHELTKHLRQDCAAKKSVAVYQSKVAKADVVTEETFLWKAEKALLLDP